MGKCCDQDTALPVTPAVTERPEEKVVFVAVTPACIRWGSDDLIESINDGWDIERVDSGGGGDLVVFAYHLVRFPEESNG